MGALWGTDLGAAVAAAAVLGATVYEGAVWEVDLRWVASGAHATLLWQVARVLPQYLFDVCVRLGCKDCKVNLVKESSGCSLQPVAAHLWPPPARVEH